MKKLIPTRVRPNERGAVIIWTAFFLVFMLGFVALGIDVAKVMATRTQLQNAADAAALAGASAVDMSDGTIVQATAVVRAQETAAQNKAFTKAPQPVQLLAGDISFPAVNEVTVIVRRDPSAGGSMVTHVAQVLGIKSLDLSATATAQVDTIAAPCDDIVPMAPIPPPGWFNPNCATTYTLKQESGSGQQGNYQLLDYPPCNEGPCQNVGGGGAAIRCYSEHGYSCCLNIGEEFIFSQPGVKAGPFRQGMQARFDSDTDRRENICYSEYRGNGKRIVQLPIIETFDVSGKKKVRITGFAAFFIKFRPTGNGDMVGQFIYDTAPGEPGGGGGTLFTIRLIK